MHRDLSFRVNVTMSLVDHAIKHAAPLKLISTPLQSSESFTEDSSLKAVQTGNASEVPRQNFDTDSELDWTWCSLGE